MCKGIYITWKFSRLEDLEENKFEYVFVLLIE